MTSLLVRQAYRSASLVARRDAGIDLAEGRLPVPKEVEGMSAEKTIGI